MTGRFGNVYENKGPAFSNPAQTGNVIENKGCYALKPGMLLKRRWFVCGRWYVGQRDSVRVSDDRRWGLALAQFRIVNSEP